MSETEIDRIGRASAGLAAGGSSGERPAGEPRGVVTPIGIRGPVSPAPPDPSPEGAAAPIRPPVRLPPLPAEKRGPPRGLWISFILCVVLPALAVGVYFFGFAARQYVAEFRFAVTESSPGLPATSSASGPGATTALLGPLAAAMGGSAGAAMQNYVVIDYLLSRQAVDELESRIKLRAMYGGPRVRQDWWARFDETQSTERFVEYWNRMVTATYDPMTGLAIVKVRAFSAEDARTIAQTMVELSETLVNTIARRPQLDAVRFAEAELKRAEARMKEVRAALAGFRVREGVIDPSGSIASTVELVKILRGQLIQLQTELATLGSQQQNVNAPAAQMLRSRIAATREQLAKVEREVAQDRDGNRVLSDIVAQYELLDLDRQYAQAMLVSTMQSLDHARANASAQHLYLTPYVRPALPESAAYPKRLQSTVLAALALLGIWLTGLMIARSVREQL